jgi:hypothetical protein
MMRLKNLRVTWKCQKCGKDGVIEIPNGAGMPWAEVTERIAAAHKEVSPDCEFDMAHIRPDFTRYADKEKNEE